MRMDSRAAEEAAVLRCAQQMCAAMRTAPKARGVDEIETLILTGAEKDELADRMDEAGDELGAGFFHRDAGNVRDAQAIVLAGVRYTPRGLNELCQLCNNRNCAETLGKDAVCVFDPMDLGIAIGSAVATAADARVDSRVLFSAGKAALGGGCFGPDVKCVMGIPLSCTGKNPFFDRKPKE